MTTQAYKLSLFTPVFFDNKLWQYIWYIMIHATFKMVPLFFIKSVYD